jgi:hypothetical protein
MTGQQQFVEDFGLRQYEYGDGVVLAADMGPGTDASVDVVDGTAIVVVAGDTYDLDLPAGDAQAFIHNGVLTVEVNA